MRLILVALCACALSACVLDDGDNEGTFTQEIKPTPTFTSEISLAGGDCNQLILQSTFRVGQLGMIEYTLSDLTVPTPMPFIYDAFLNGTALDFNQLVGVLRALPIGQTHLFLLQSQVTDENGKRTFKDRIRTTLPCSL